MTLHRKIPGPPPGPPAETGAAAELAELIVLLEAGSGRGVERLQALIRSIRAGKVLPGVGAVPARRERAQKKGRQGTSKSG